MPISFSSPKKAWRASWLADPICVRQLDEDVRCRLEVARKLRGNTQILPPFTIELLVGHVERSIRFQRWFVGTGACALLGELLWVSDEIARTEKAPVIYKLPPRRKAQENPRAELHRPLLSLRNACFHPANVVGEGENVPAVAHLVETLRKRGEGALADYLEKEWPRLHDPQVTAWAINAVDRAGRYDLGKDGRTTYTYTP